MSLFPNARRRASGNLWLAVFLVATLALSAWLAFQAWDAVRSHRVTAEGVLRDYAGLAAWEYSREAEDGLDDFFHILLDARRRGAWRSRSAQSIAREMREALEDARCEYAVRRRAPRGRGFRHGAQELTGWRTFS